MNGAALAAVLAFLPAGAFAADAVRGAALYHGLPGAPEVSARLGTGPRLPAARLACGNCHGQEAEGGGEGGILAPPLGAQRLARRGLRDPAALGVALRTGAVPDGGLSIAMPRFVLDEAAVADLAAYLADRHAVDAPGVTVDRLALGVGLPPSLRPLRELLAAWATALNGQGGIWGRSVELVDLPADAPSLARALTEHPVLLVLAPLLDPDAQAVLQRGGIPQLGPLAPTPTGPAWRIGPDVLDQVAALLELAPAGPGPLPVLLPRGGDGGFRAVLPATGIEARPVTAWRPAELRAAGRALVLTPLPDDPAWRDLPADLRLLAPLEIAAATLRRPDVGGTWILAERRTRDLPDDPGELAWYAQAVTQLTELALERAGRGVTRRRLATALDATTLTSGGIELDYAKVPGHGTRLVGLLELDPTGHLTRLAARAAPTIKEVANADDP